MIQFFIYIYIYIYMSSTPEPLRFVYGRWRIDTPEVKSCVNIPEVEDGKQFLKMISIAYRKSNRALTYRKSRGVSNEWKWVAWKEKMTTWTFHVLKAWNSYDLSTVVDESTHRKYDGSTSTVTSRWIRVNSTTSPTTGGPSSSCEMIILRNNSHGGIIRVCMGIFTYKLL